MQIYLSLLVALIGGLMFLLCTGAGWKELGRLSFGCGLLVFLLNVSHMVNLLPPFR
jgi:hypothetical protein